MISSTKLIILYVYARFYVNYSIQINSSIDKNWLGNFLSKKLLKKIFFMIRTFQFSNEDAFKKKK